MAGLSTPHRFDQPTTFAAAVLTDDNRLIVMVIGVVALAALVVLVAAVLPAEYGIDPTGLGRRLGLYRPPAQAIEPAVLSDASGNATPAGATLVQKKTPFRSDEMSLVLESGEGAEIKAVMAAGDHFMYTWTAEGGPVDVDMHGEAFNAQEELPSYFKDEGQSGDNGVFRASIAGRHGWFWQNLNDTPVTIKLKTSGFYERLMRP
jgi:hypothetical protein